MANTIIITLPVPTIATFGGGAAWLQLPSLEITASGHNSTGDFAFKGALPSLSLAAYVGASAKLTMPMLALSASSTAVNLASVAAVLPMPIVSATGTVAQQANVSLTMPMVKMIGYGGAVINVTLNNSLTLVSNITAGGVATVAVTLPMFDLVATATPQNHVSANLILPALRAVNSASVWMLAPMVQLVAIGSATVAVTYEGYALNLKHDIDTHDELTHYTNYPFDKIIRYKNSYFGVSPTGLFLLEGTTDWAAVTPTNVPWEARTSVTDFGSEQQKTVNSAYFGARLGAIATISLYAGETGSQAYSFTTPRGETAQNYRQVFGRGVKSRYYALGASGNGVLAIDSITFNIATMARKV